MLASFLSPAFLESILHHVDTTSMQLFIRPGHAIWIGCLLEVLLYAERWIRTPENFLMVIHRVTVMARRRFDSTKPTELRFSALVTEDDARLVQWTKA